MADEDKLLGIAKTNRTTEYTYSAYRVDYDSADSIAEIVTVETTDDEGNVVSVPLTESDQTVGDYFTGAIKNPPAGYPGHEAKSGYQRKVLVEADSDDDPNTSIGETTRDEVTAALDDAGISYEIAGVEPTDEEKAHIEDYGAQNSLEGASAMEWKRALEDLAAGNISQVDLERGRNPTTGNAFGRPNPGRGRGN